MSTFIINLNDTIAMSDSAVVELAKVISTCQSCVQEAETNCNFAVVELGKVIGTCQSCVQEAETNCEDVKIVAIICAAIVLVALIVKWAVCSWKKSEKDAVDAERKAKKEKEKEDSERKQKADLLGKHLDFLKENASKDEKWIEGYKEVIASFKEALQNEIKEYDNMYYHKSVDDKNKIIEILEKQLEYLKDNGSRSNAKAEKEYQRVLAYLIEKSQQNKMNEITQKDILGEQKEGTSSEQTPGK